MEILNITKTNKSILATTYDETVLIDKSDFEEWVTDEQKREWMQVYADHNGDPVENEGTIPWSEYYTSPQIRKDIEEYISITTKKTA